MFHNLQKKKIHLFIECNLLIILSTVLNITLRPVIKEKKSHTFSHTVYLGVTQYYFTVRIVAVVVYYIVVGSQRLMPPDILHPAGLL